VQKLEESGVIQRRVAILDAQQVNAGVMVFVSIKTDKHSLNWLEKFHSAVAEFPEVVEFYRMSGEIDYLLRVAVPDIAAYDAFYKKLISRVDIAKVSSAFAMEQIKYTTALPLQFAITERSGKSERAEA
jgi:Lrp/AsnC family transcriptional regulator